MIHNFICQLLENKIQVGCKTDIKREHRLRFYGVRVVNYITLLNYIYAAPITIVSRRMVVELIALLLLVIDDVL